MRSTRSTKSTSEDEVTLKTLDNKLDLVLSEFSSIKSRLTAIENTQKEFEKSLEFVHQETRKNDYNISRIENSVKHVEQKLEEYKSLDERIETSEHHERAKCVELNGIEYSKDEDLMTGFDRIIKNLKMTSISTTQDIDKIYRIRQTKRIVVKFVHTNKRDTFFHTYRKSIMSTKQLGFQTDSKIFINEVLSSKQRDLFWKTRNFKKSNNYKYVWTFAQRIYLRKTPDSEAIQINDVNDLENLKCV